MTLFSPSLRPSRISFGVCLTFFGLFLAGSAAAQDKRVEAQADHAARYTLFNPVPASLMREMNTDRPDTTEGPFTVDAGHFQIEASFFDFQRSFDGGQRTDQWSFGQINIRTGLTSQTELDLMFDSYDTLRTTGGGVASDLSGFSDVTVRMKVNLWGNAGEGKTALGLIPYVGIPTRAAMGSDRWGGGLVVPFSINLAEGWSLGTMIQADLVPSAASSGYEVGWIHSASLGIELTKQLEMYVELVGIATTGGMNYQALFNTGVVFSATDNLSFDTGVRVGMNHDTPDFGIFTGMSIRF